MVTVGVDDQWQRATNVVEREAGEGVIRADARLSPAALRCARGVVEAVGATRLLELGSGASTVVLAGLCRRGVRQLDSVDGERHYLEATRQELRKAGVEGSVRLHHAPIGPLTAGLYFGLGYRLGPVLDHAPFDFALIDGPPALAIGRFMTLLSIWPHLDVGAIVLLDDAGRETLEGRWVSEWRAIFGPALRTTVFTGYAKGLGVLQKLAESPRSIRPAIWRAHAEFAARSVARRLVRFGPPST